MNDPMHTLELRLPIKLADRLIAKGGSMDAAVHEALTMYLQTDLPARNAKIKEFVDLGRSIDKLAEFHGLTPENILAIAGR